VQSILWKSSVFVVNEHEAEFYTGMVVETTDDALDAARKLRSGGLETVVVTLGDAGSVAVHGREEFVTDAVQVHVVDTTAAGDTFIGGLCTEWMRTGNLHEAMGFASAAAAISVSRFGAQTSIPLNGEVRQMTAGSRD
jgi:ribokinase